MLPTSRSTSSCAKGLVCIPRVLANHSCYKSFLKNAKVNKNKNDQSSQKITSKPHTKAPQCHWLPATRFQRVQNPEPNKLANFQDAKIEYWSLLIHMFAFSFYPFTPPFFKTHLAEARSEEKGKEKLLYFRKVLRNVVTLQEWWGRGFVGSSAAAKIIQTKQQQLRLRDPESRSPDGCELFPDRRTAIGICGPRLEKRWHLGQLGYCPDGSQCWRWCLRSPKQEIRHGISLDTRFQYVPVHVLV